MCLIAVMNCMAKTLFDMSEVKTMYDIREIDGLWCDDITFCPKRCGWLSCPRNERNIRDRRIPHSFSVGIPLDCPKCADEESKEGR